MALSKKDCELFACLLRKIKHRDLLPNYHTIHEVDIWDFHPKKLTESYPPSADGAWYFLTPIYLKVTEDDEETGDTTTCRGAGRGLWMCTAVEQYRSTPEGMVRGIHKAPFSYFETGGITTEWRLLEYSISKVALAHDLVNDDEWGLCKLYAEGSEADSSK